MTPRPFGDGLWLAEGPPVRAALGFLYPTRMAFMAHGAGVIAWSPTDLTPAVEEGLAALPPVVGIVSPTRLHDTWLRDWQAAFPRARVWGPPDLRVAGLRVDHDVAALPEGFDVVRWPHLAPEAVIHHRRSRTVLVADLVQQLSPRWFEGWRRWVAWADRMTAPRPEMPRKFRLATRDRAAARAARDRMLRWEPERLVLAHGPVLERGAKAALDHATRWL